MRFLDCYGAARRVGIKITDLQTRAGLERALKRVPERLKKAHPEAFAAVKGFCDDYDGEAAAALAGQLTGHPVASTHVGGHGHLALDTSGASLSLINTQLELDDHEHPLALELSSEQVDALRPLLHPQWLGVADQFVRRFSVPQPPPRAPLEQFAVTQATLTRGPDHRLITRLRRLVPADSSARARHDLILRWGDNDHHKRVAVALEPGQFDALFSQVAHVEQRQRSVHRYQDHDVTLDTLSGNPASTTASIAFHSRKEADRFIYTLPKDHWLRPR